MSIAMRPADKTPDGTSNETTPSRPSIQTKTTSAPAPSKFQSQRILDRKSFFHSISKRLSQLKAKRKAKIARRPITILLTRNDTVGLSTRKSAEKQAKKRTIERKPATLLSGRSRLSISLIFSISFLILYNHLAHKLSKPMRVMTKSCFLLSPAIKFTHLY